MKPESPRTISVYVATYKRVDALELVLLGLLNQTRMPEQVIVVEDGTWKENRKLTQSFQEKFDGRLLHLTQMDKGNRLNVSRNRGINACTSDFIAMLDGDMVPHPRYVEDYLRWAKPGYFIQPRRVRLNQALTDRAIAKKQVRFTWLTPGIERRIQAIWSPLLTRLFSTTDQSIRHTRGANFGFWHEDLVAINGFDMGYKGWGHNDWDTVQRMFHLGRKRLYLRHAALAHHLEHPDQSRQERSDNRKRFDNVVETRKIRCELGLDQLAQID